MNDREQQLKDLGIALEEWANGSVPVIEVALAIEALLTPGSAQQAPCDCPEVCKVCGGRAKACAVLGHRIPADRDVKWHECPTEVTGSAQQAPQSDSAKASAE